MATDVIARGMASNSLKEAKAYTDTFNSQVTNIAPTSDGTGLIFTVVGGETFTIGVDDWNALTDEEKQKISALDISGDGTKYLANDGQYKTIDGVSSDYETFVNKPQINSATLEGDIDSVDLGIKTSDLTNDSNFVSDENYVHTDNNFTNEEKEKISTNTSDITLLDNQILQLSNYVEYFPNNVVGLHADFQNMEFDRLAGAESLTMGADFNKFNMYGGRKRCLLADDGVVIAYNDGTQYVCNDTSGTTITLANGESGLLTTEVIIGSTTYTVGTQIQVMVEQPKFYYKVIPIKLDKQIDGVGYHLRSANYYISDYKYDGFKLHPCFYNENGNEVDYIYLSAYEGNAYDVSANAYLMSDEQIIDFVSSGDKLSSIFNTKPMSGLTQRCTRQDVEQIAKNRGNGWHSLTIKSMSAEQLLMFIEMGGFNSQTNITNGVVNIVDNSAYNCSSLTGSTQNLANGIGQATSTINEINGTQTTYTNNGRTSICYRGVENDWGNIWKFVYGINIYGDGSQKGGIPYICKDYNFAESKNSDNYESVEFTITDTSGYISAFAYSENFDYLFLPSESLGNSNLPIGDYVSSNLIGYSVVLLGGRWNTDPDLINPNIIIAQDTELQQILGYQLYTYIMDLVS